MAIQYGTHIIHTVQPGDTVYSLAVRYESDVDAISQANGLYPPFTDPFVIYTGQVLVIPRQLVDPTETFYVAQPGDNLILLAQRFSTHWELLAGINPTVQNPNIIFPNQQLRVPVFAYDVELNDTLNSISQVTGVPIEEILLANSSRPAISQDLIYEGIKVLIPIPSSQNIVVVQPFPGSIVRDNSIIEGFARAFEANVLYRLVDDNNTEVIEETFTTAEYAGPNYGRFRESVTFDTEPTSEEEGTLQVFTRSARDGSIQDLVEIRVRFE
ncbi:LysM peptidoglycan-binding domain-containing protein [Salipaludibacillus sp. CF4.18]|uniref:LysM peptidoglycan-binding domain-containing protein n=1 Tax=Salipaludibacillus sp. CF4.18 TaxID=3373081 RepID=UPI003EE7E834